MPSTEKFYIITGIEWKNGATVAGTIMCGVDLVDADPPVNTGSVNVAVSQKTTASGASSVQRCSVIASRVIRGGTIVGAWVNGNNSTHTLREQTGLGSQNQQKASSYTETAVPTNETTAWTTATARKYLKVYYVGYT